MADRYSRLRDRGGRTVTVNRAESFDADGRPRRPINDRLIANDMRKSGCTAAQVLHAVGYLPDLTLTYGEPHPGRIRFDVWGHFISDTHSAPG